MKQIFVIIIALTLTLMTGRALAQDAENIEQVGRIYNQWSSSRYIITVGDLAYISAGFSGLQIVDISDPESPEVIGFWDENLESIRGISISGNYAYLAEGWNGIRIISIEDPENPEQIGLAETEEYAWDVAVSGDFAYVGLDRGFSVVSISDPENPREIGFTDRVGSKSVAISGDYAYVANGGGFNVIAVSNPENPHVIGNIAGFFRDLTISGDYAYVTEGTSPREGYSFRIFSIADPENPEQVASLNVGGVGVYGISGITVSGDYAYLACGAAGLNVYSVVDPENPEGIGSFNPERFVFDVSVSGDNAYIVSEDGGGGGLNVISISDPEDLFEVGHHYAPGEIQNVRVTDEYAFVADGSEGLRIVSIIEPDNPVEVGHFETDGETYDIHLSGDYAFIADGLNGFCVISISDPENPEEVGSFYPGGNTLDVTVSTDYAYIATIDKLVVVSIYDLEDIREVGYYQTPGRALGVDLSEDGLIYVADDTNLGIYRSSFDPFPPHIDLSLDTLNFNEVKIDSSHSLTLSIMSVGRTNLSVSDIVVEGDQFDADFDSLFIIEPDSSHDITVVFIPDSISNFEGTLIIVSDDPRNDTLSVNLYGIGSTFPPHIDLSLDTLHFNEVVIDSFNALTLSIMSVGRSNLTVSNITVNEDQFSTDFDTLFVIEPDSSHDVLVTFTPDAIGEFEGTLVIVSDDPNNDTLTVTLLGIGPDEVNDDHSTLPIEYHLSKAYPNPFNSMTSLSYSLPSSSEVSVCVFNVNGRLINTLVDQRQEIGRYSVVWNGMDAPAGVYLVQMQADEFSEVRKIVLVK